MLQNLFLPTLILLWVASSSQASSTRDVTAHRQKCLEFRPQSYVYNSTLEVLEYVEANTTLLFPDNDSTCSRPYQLVSVNLCRVALSIPTSNRSSITYEHWFPDAWTGRFLATGNGGIDGCVKYEDLAYGSSYGFAVTGTNNGHNGTSGLSFYRNEDVVIDYSWRALHTSVQAGKVLTEVFYQQPHKKSYYIGCSGGGRQGIKTAEMFPNDFDGIVVGAPGVDFNNLYSWRGHFYPITGPIGSPNFINASTWTGLIHNEVLNQCDGLDGVMDGIIEDPDLCHFNPATLLCVNGTTYNSTRGACLTPVQVEMVRKIFEPFEYENGTLIYPAMQPGSEVMAVTKLYAGAPFSYSLDWFRYVVYSNPNWDPLTLTSASAADAEALNPANVRTWPSSLSDFYSSNGKILAYHGGQDNQITSYNTERFYNHLRHGMNIPDFDEFFRFFRIPGMFHCNSGPGAWAIGQGGGTSAAGIPFNRRNNVLAAIVAWVEESTAPEIIQGTKFINDTANLGVNFRRNHCRYPLRVTYTGGNYKDIDSWECLHG